MEYQVPAFPVCGVRFFFLVVNVETEVSFQLHITLTVKCLKRTLYYWCNALAHLNTRKNNPTLTTATI